MTAINWESLKETMGGNFTDYAPDGKYTVKCTDIELKEVGSNGSVVQKFKFAEDNYKYPTADHWLSFKNEGWRQWHNKNLMMVLGASEENAKKAVELCESKEGKDAIVKAYEQTYKKLLSKKPEVEIEVFTDDKYSKSDFTDRSVAMPRDTKPAEETKDVIPEDDEVSDEEIEITDIPF